MESAAEMSAVELEGTRLKMPICLFPDITTPIFKMIHAPSPEQCYVEAISSLHPHHHYHHAERIYSSSPVSMAVLSFFFHCSATSFARGSSGLGALNNAWIDSNTVRICRAGDHLSGRWKVQKRHAKGEKEDSSKVQFVKQTHILPQHATNRNQAARIMKQIHFFLRLFSTGKHVWL